MIEISAFLSFTIAVVLLLIGKIITLRSELLRRFSIPEPVLGGLLCAAIVALVYAVSGMRIEFELGVRDYFLLVFFAGIGLGSDIGTLLKGGRPLLLLLMLATIFIVAQNAVGVAVAAAFGLNPLAGLMAGSISLTGGVGTTVAWAPIFIERFGIANAMELGIAANTVGLISACVIGGPIAAFLIRQHNLPTSSDPALEIGVTSAPKNALDHFCILWSILAIHITIMLGVGLNVLIAKSGLMLPAFVGCLVAGILIRNLVPATVDHWVVSHWPGIREGMALISDLALGLFLMMALMGLKVWALNGVFAFVSVVLSVQIALTVAYVLLVVFRVMGRNYEAAVICAGFGGITLGSTATAIANMTAVTQQHGAAHQAFIIVPLVCGFFIDIINAFVVSAFIP